MKRWMLLLGMSVLCSGVFAQYLRITYAGDELPSKEKERIERFLTHEYEFYARLGWADTTSLQLTFFNVKQDAYDYLSDIDVKLPSLNTGGLYLPRRKEAIIVGRRKEQSQHLKIVIHELTHHLNRHAIKAPPGWMNEGLAEYFEHCEWEAKGLKHELTDYEIGRLRTMYMLDEVNLKDFIDNEHKDFHQRLHADEQYAYVLSHALVTFMMEEADESFMNTFVDRLNRSVKRGKYSTLIQLIYPGGFVQFEHDFADFCLNKK